MSESPAASPPSRRIPAFPLLVAGALFLVGAISIVMAFVGGFSGTNPSTAMHVGALCAPIGLATAVGYALRAGRRAPRKD